MIIRLYSLNNERVKVCEHIVLEEAKEVQYDEGCEYEYSLNIRCAICDDVHKIRVLVN